MTCCRARHPKTAKKKIPNQAGLEPYSQRLELEASSTPFWPFFALFQKKFSTLSPKKFWSTLALPGLHKKSSNLHKRIKFNFNRFPKMPRLRNRQTGPCFARLARQPRPAKLRHTRPTALSGPNSPPILRWLGLARPGLFRTRSCSSIASTWSAATSSSSIICEARSMIFCVAVPAAMQTPDLQRYYFWELVEL